MSFKRDVSLDQLSLLPAAQQEEILNGPALQPPMGVLPNFEDPPNGNAITHFTIALCLVLTTAGFLLRTYSRIFRTGKFEIEDYLAGAVFGIFIGYVYCMYWVTSLHGFLIHQWDVKVKDLAGILYIINVGANLHSVTIMVIKTAILKEWSRIFVPHGTRNTFYWICHVVLWFNIIFYVAVIVGLNLACIPARGIWDKTIPAKCFDSKSMLIVAAAVNVVLNFIILLLPQRIIWHLQMSPKKKLGVSLIFTVGLLYEATISPYFTFNMLISPGCSACISSIFRLEATIVHYRSEDAVYSVTVVALWALAEMACLLLVFFVPAIPKVISGNGVATRLAISIKSLPGIPSRFRSEIPMSPYKGPQNRVTRPTGTYQRLDAYGFPLSNITNMSSRHRPESESAEGLQVNTTMEEQEQGILRTTHFIARIEHVDSDLGRDEFNQQHPWISNDVDERQINEQSHRRGLERLTL